jgi:hypothetical protein
MRIPIVSEAQFRELLRQGAAQETLVDGVPVWQLTAPVPAEIRAAAPSALEFVARALHRTSERLDEHDRFALVACAEAAEVLTRSTSGADRAELMRGIDGLRGLDLGDQTDLARGIELALDELRRGRAGRPEARAERLVLLTDGFTQRADECLRLASVAAAEGIAISTIGLGGEFQEDVLTEMADRTGGRAVFLRKPDAIPATVTAELEAARAVAVRGVVLHATLADGIALHRATKIRPTLTPLPVPSGGSTSPGEAATIRLGDIEDAAPVTLLLEFLAPPHHAGAIALGRLAATGDDAPTVATELRASYNRQPAAPPAAVLDAAARANAARLQLRALETAGHGEAREAARLLRAAAGRLDDLGEHALARLARGQAATLERGGEANPIAAKELAYATRRLGGA